MEITANELVIEYAQQIAIILREKRALKELMRDGLDSSDGFCEDPGQPGTDEEENCLRARIRGHIKSDEAMCDTCRKLWPHVSAKYQAKQQRGKLLRKIGALGRKLDTAQTGRNGGENTKQASSTSSTD